MATSAALCVIWVGVCALLRSPAAPMTKFSPTFIASIVAVVVMLGGRGLIEVIVRMAYPRPHSGTWDDAQLTRYARVDACREALEWTCGMLAVFLLLLPEPIRFPPSLILVWVAFAIVIGLLMFPIKRKRMREERVRALGADWSPEVFE